MLELLVRPALQPDEWWNGYVARALAQNGFAADREYMLGKLEPKVAQLVSFDERQRAIAGDIVGNGIRAYSTWLLPKWAVRGIKSAAAHCPECLAESQHMRLAWRLRCITHCSKHNCLLQTQCHACKRSLFHWDVARQACRCGAPFERAISVSTTGAGPLFSCAEIGRSFFRLHSGAGSETREIVAVMVLLGALVPALAKVSVVGRPESSRRSLGLLAEHGVTLESSKLCVEQLLSKLASAAHLRAALKVLLQIDEAEKRQQTVLSHLPLWQWVSQLCAQGASPRQVERKGLVEPGSLQQGLLPMKRAARQAGLSGMHLHYLVARGKVVPARTFSRGERQHLFSGDQIESMKAHRHFGYTYGHTLDLELDASSRQVLRVSGVVSTVQDSVGRTWLDGSELRALLKSLDSRAKEIETVPKHMFSLGSNAIWRRRHVPALKAMIDRLLSGQFALWKFGHTSGFARFYVGLDALELLHRGATAGIQRCSADSPQLSMPFSGGCTSWKPTPTPWSSQAWSGRGRPRHTPGVQLALDM